jgi:ribosomal-protein-alanine N-acetyltransferase
LRAFVREDRDDVHRYSSNPRVAEHMTWSVHRSLEDTDAFLARVIAAPDDQYDWAVRESADARVIGGFQFSLRSEREGQLDYTLAEDVWGQGFATEAAQAVLNWAMTTFPTVQRVVGGVVVGNRGSERVVTKCGMVEAGRYEEHWAKYDRVIELATYALTRQSWEKLPWRAPDTDAA